MLFVNLVAMGLYAQGQRFIYLVSKVCIQSWTQCEFYGENTAQRTKKSKSCIILIRQFFEITPTMILLFFFINFSIFSYRTSHIQQPSLFPHEEVWAISWLEVNRVQGSRKMSTSEWYIDDREHLKLQ